MGPGHVSIEILQSFKDEAQISMGEESFRKRGSVVEYFKMSK